MRISELRDVSIQNPCPAPPPTHIHPMLWVFENLRFSAQVALNLFSSSFSCEFIPSRSEKDAGGVHTWSHQGVDISKVALEGFGVQNHVLDSS